MASLALQNLSKTFSGAVRAVDDVSLTIPAGCFCALLGPSGCGKSTLLRMIAGIESASSGEVVLDGTAVTNWHPKDRDMAMVFQSYALYPHLTVEENIAFPLTMRKVPKPERKRRVAEVADQLQLKELLDRRPAQLSGGQRQRVAVARAIVRQPKVFLFDEPLSNLDAKLRLSTRAELKQLHRRLRITSIYVTHDQEEAMALGDLVVVMAKGKILQAAAPLDLFDAPANRFVAAFIGSPPMNFLDATLKHNTDGSVQLHTPIGVSLPLADLTASSDGAVRKVVWGVRPSSFRIAETEGPGTLTATIESIEPLGESMDLILNIRGQKMTARIEARRGLSQGASVPITIDTHRTHIFDATGEGARIPCTIPADCRETQECTV